MGPNVPLGPALALHVGAQVTVRELAFGQLGGDVVQLFPQGRVAGVGPGQRRGVQPFADVLAVPGLAAGPVPVAFQQARRVQLCQAIAFVGDDACADPAAQMHSVRHLEILPVGDGGRDLLGDGDDGGCLRHHRHSCNEDKGQIACRHSLLLGLWFH